MKKIIWLIFLCVFGKNSFCQNSYKLDSLLKALPTQAEDTLKVKTLIRICHQYLQTDPQKVIEYGRQSLDLTKKLKWKRGIGMSYSLIGDGYYYQGNFTQALNNRLNELKIWKELNYTWQTCSTLGNIASIYADLGENVKALEQYFQTLKFAEEIKHNETIITTLCNIGGLYKEMNDTAKALLYLSKSLKLADQYKFENFVSINLINIGSIYSDQHLHSTALSYFAKALEIIKRTGNKQNLAGLLTNIGAVYQLQSDSASEKGNVSLGEVKMEQALNYLFEALQEAKEIKNSFIEATVLGNIGAIYLTQKKHTQAEKYFKESLDLSIAVGTPDLILSNYKRLYESYKKTDKHSDALKYYEKYIKLKDSIFSEQNKNTISELQIKYDTEKKEAENTKLAQKNKILELSVTNNKYLTFGLISLSLLIFGIGFLMIRQNRLKSKQENVKLEQKLLRTQMNPHFIFNSLANIESFIYEHQPKEAGDYLAQFARLMRLILENSSSEYITLDKELETLKYYFSLQKLRLNDNLDYTIDVDEAIDTSQVLLPPMLTQPFIENAIEHGFRGISETGKIKVYFKLKENNLEIKIIDNGIGIVKAQQQKELYKKHNSMAMKITYERLAFFNKSKNQKLVFSIKELEQEQGTEVVFSIPIQN